MRKITLLLVFVLSSLSSVFAKFIDVNTAQTVAVTYYRYNGTVDKDTKLMTISLAYTRIEADKTVDFYVFNFTPRGFVIVSADDNAEPVIAFSSETTFNSNIPNSGIQDWMDNAAYQVNYIIKNNLQADVDIASKWTAYSNGQNIIQTRASAISPLLTTIWNQDPIYNNDCPGGSVTGCVATAMAQIMKFWNFPSKGTGSYSYSDAPYGSLSANFGNTTYQWTSMPSSVSSVSNTTEQHAVALLSYQAGVSVAMEYSPSGSGAYVLQSDDPGGPCAQYSYTHYFGYNATTIQGIIQSNYTSAKWSALLENELNEGRPIQYVGYGSEGGHTWVCDGYTASGLFHMNWGWGGADDGYYKTSNLNPGGVPLGSDNEALIGIEPKQIIEPVLSTNPTTPDANSLNNINNGSDQTESYYYGIDRLDVYPIPASSTVNVRYEGSKFSTANVLVVNALGQTVAAYTGVNLNSNYQLDISKYIPGVYFLSVTTTDGSDRKVIKLIKQ